MDDYLFPPIILVDLNSVSIFTLANIPTAVETIILTFENIIQNSSKAESLAKLLNINCNHTYCKQTTKKGACLLLRIPDHPQLLTTGNLV